jgi:hypothetical protein
MKNEFFVQRKLILPKQICLPYQDVYMCTIWDHLNKLYQICSIFFGRWLKKPSFDATLTLANQMTRIHLPRITLIKHLNRQSTPSNAPHCSEKTQTRPTQSNPRPPQRFQTLVISSPSRTDPRRPLLSLARSDLPSPPRICPSSTSSSPVSTDGGARAVDKASAAAAAAAGDGEGQGPRAPLGGGAPRHLLLLLLVRLPRTTRIHQIRPRRSAAFRAWWQQRSTVGMRRSSSLVAVLQFHGEGHQPPRVRQGLLRPPQALRQGNTPCSLRSFAMADSCRISMWFCLWCRPYIFWSFLNRILLLG